MSKPDRPQYRASDVNALVYSFLFQGVSAQRHSGACRAPEDQA
jgi:hypothetical protein